MRPAMSHAALTFGLAAMALAACTRLSGPDGMARRPATVTVSGVGVVSAAPDMAEITTGVVTQAPAAAQALAANSQAMERLLQALGGLGIAARDIQTTNVSVTPLRRQGRDGQPPEITGYEVTNQVRVKVRDLARLGRVLDAPVGKARTSCPGSGSACRSRRRRSMRRVSGRWPTRAARPSCTRARPG